MNNKFPNRKHPRLLSFDYSSAGTYFITICTQDRCCILSHIVGRGLAPAEVLLTEYGLIAENQLFLLKDRYPQLEIDHYVIMPNHIHVIFRLTEDAAGASPRPTIMDIVCAYKSLTTRECRKANFYGKLFQTSFHEHIIRGQEDYSEITKYIRENPTRWQSDILYSQSESPFFLK